MLASLRIATRKSPLALWQANFVANSLMATNPHLTVELIPMLTSGDKFTKDKLQDIGGKGLFVKELEEALLLQKADIAVHSMKDVPAIQPPGLEIATICQRDNPLDMLVSNQYEDLAQLPINSVIGTSSLRRQSQLLAFRPDLIVKPLRGNIHTRLQKLTSENFDAIILAAAGLQRMAITDFTQSLIASDIMLPACGQGALGIECRSDNYALKELLQPLGNELTRLCVLAERQVNALLGGNCHVPLAVYAKTLEAGEMLLEAKVLSTDGKVCVADKQLGKLSNHLELADSCAANLLKNGAAALLAAPKQ